MLDFHNILREEYIAKPNSEKESLIINYYNEIVKGKSLICIVFAFLHCFNVCFSLLPDVLLLLVSVWMILLAQKCLIYNHFTTWNVYFGTWNYFRFFKSGFAHFVTYRSQIGGVTHIVTYGSGIEGLAHFVTYMSWVREVTQFVTYGCGI